MDIAHAFSGTPFEKVGDYGLVHISSIVSTVNVLRLNLAIVSFTDNSPWPLHRFYLICFITANVAHLTLDHDSLDR